MPTVLGWGGRGVVGKSALLRLGRRRVVAWFRRNLSGSVAIAPALVILGSAPVAAQVNCAGIGAQNCALATDQYPFFQAFNSLPNSPAGINLLNANLSAVNSIYLNATQAQRLQAAQNADTSGTGPQTNIWGMISNLPASSFPLNASSFTNFPSVATSAALASTMTNQIALLGGN